MKISNLEKVQEYLYQLKHIRDDAASLTHSNIISVSFYIQYSRDVSVSKSDVIPKIVNLVTEHLKKQEQEIIKKLLELGVTVENEN